MLLVAIDRHDVIRFAGNDKYKMCIDRPSIFFIIIMEKNNQKYMNNMEISLVL